MTSNISKMTVEERLVKHIKETGLGLLIDDEDAITELTRRAIEAALIQPRRVYTGGYYDRDQDSPVVAAAREVAREALRKLADEQIEKIKADPKSMEAIQRGMGAAVAEVLKEGISQLMNYAAQNAVQQALQPLRDNGLLR